MYHVMEVYVRAEALVENFLENERSYYGTVFKAQHLHILQGVARRAKTTGGVSEAVERCLRRKGQSDATKINCQKCDDLGGRCRRGTRR